jgi:hypothetical protein
LPVLEAASGPCRRCRQLKTFKMPSGHRTGQRNKRSGFESRQCVSV